MLNEQELKYETVKDYVNFLALSNKVDTVTFNEPFNRISLGKIPQSMEEARYHANFWNPIIEDFKGDIKEIEFFYQEKDKELPFSYGQRLLKIIGFKINPKVETGEIKYGKIAPELIRYVDSSKTLVNMVTKEDEWKRLNTIAQDSDTFSAPFVFLPKNLCYQVNIPLECINGIGFNLTEFLNKQYTNKILKC